MASEVEFRRLATTGEESVAPQAAQAIQTVDGFRVQIEGDHVRAARECDMRGVGAGVAAEIDGRGGAAVRRARTSRMTCFRGTVRV